jgi:hypothetical protein
MIPFFYALDTTLLPVAFVYSSFAILSIPSCSTRGAELLNTSACLLKSGMVKHAVDFSPFTNSQNCSQLYATPRLNAVPWLSTTDTDYMREIIAVSHITLYFLWKDGENN